MICRAPAYCGSFSCSASACTDTCCRGWEIDIDPSSLARYKAHTGPLKERFAKGILEREKQASFRLRVDESCPFLRPDGLCDIYLVMGPESLCRICSEHPRFYDTFDGIREMGIGLACEEAAKLILTHGDYTSVNRPGKGKFADLLNLRSRILETPERFLTVLSEDFFLWKKGEISRLFAFMETLEIDTPQWKTVLGELKKRGEGFLPGRETLFACRPGTEKELTHLFCYFVYRHFMKARYYDRTDRGAETQLLFANLCTAVILLSDLLRAEKGKLSFADQVDIAKLFSREIEYSEENTLALENYCYTEGEAENDTQTHDL